MTGDPLTLPQDEFALVKDLRERISAAIEEAWWSSRPASPAVMEVIAPLIARAEAAEEKAAALEAALRRHMQTFTETKLGEDLCGGCLHPAPCPDAALIAEGQAP